MVESYVSGPEVDVNVVLQDGKALFCEISDDLPKTAEGFPTSFNSKSWTETGNVFPSALPEPELQQLKEKTVEYLLTFGFRTGIFHCEARM